MQRSLASTSGFKIQQGTVFILTFLSYASFHACRQSFADAKKSMQHSWNYTKHEEGAMDAFFLFSYAFGQYFSGLMGDILDAKRVHALGLFCTGTILIIFTLIHTYTFSVLYIIWILNGLFQSAGWPTAVKIVSKWFNTNHNGAIFGIWASNRCIGNIMGAVYVTIAQTKNLPIEWMFYLPSIQALIMSILVFIFVKTNPPNNESDAYESAADDNPLRLAPHKKHDKKPYEQINAESMDQEFEDEQDINHIIVTKQRLSFIEILKLKHVMTYSLCFSCLKAVDYSMLFWLPYFESNRFDAVSSHTVVISYNIGQILGGLSCGYISDRFYKRTPVVMIFLFASIAPILLLQISTLPFTMVMILTFSAGFLIGGPSTTLSTVMAAEIAMDSTLRGNYSIVSSVTGIIDGSGSVGSAITQYFVAILSDKGTERVFILFASMLLLSAILLTPLCVGEYRHETEVYGGVQHENLVQSEEVEIEKIN